MRLFLLTVFSVVFLIGTTGELSECETVLRGVRVTQLLFSYQVAAFGSPQQPVRSPDTVTGQPGAWPQQATRKLIDVNELKTRANELVTMSQALIAQLDQIGNGKYPKDLIDNLKKIEKLSKHIRSEIE
jgi:hypothetical protein